MDKISVLVVDDHPVVREGLEGMLSTRRGFAVAGLCADGEDAVAFCQAHGAPDVVLADIRMPKADGFAMLERLRKAFPRIRVLLLAGMPLKAEVERAKALGAGGYLPKSADPDVIVAALERIASEPDCFIDETPVGEQGLLTPREAEVLEYLRIGKTREEIAVILGVSVETVKTHVKSLFIRLDAMNATAAVNRAYELGILRP